MKTSVNYWMVGGFEGAVPLAEAAQAAKDIGYDCIEPCFGAGELVPEASESDLIALKEAVDKVGISIESMATGSYWGMNLGSDDDAERQKAVAFTEAYIKAAAIFGVDAILVVPGSVDVCFDPDRPIVPAKTVWENAQKSIKSVLPLAEEKGVALALENVWSKFLTGPFEYAAFIDSFDSPFVKAYFDVGNCIINGYAEHWIEVLGDRVAKVHVKNFKRNEGGGTLGDFTSSLNEGDVNWAAVFPALKAIGYDGPLTCEMLVCDGGLPNNEYAATICKELQDLMAKHGQLGLAPKTQ